MALEVSGILDLGNLVLCEALLKLTQRSRLMAVRAPGRGWRTEREAKAVELLVPLRLRRKQGSRSFCPTRLRLVEASGLLYVIPLLF